MLHQQCALVRRHCIIISRRPIRSLIRLVLWPSLILLIAIFILTSLAQDESAKSKNQLIEYSMHAPATVTIFFVYWFADLLIKDKSTGMKKLMLSMNLTRFNYYCAHSICWQLYLLPVSLCMATLTKLYLLDETVSWPIIILLYTLFSLHLESATSFLVSFITSPIFSALFPVLIFFESLLGMLTGKLQPSSGGIIGTLILGLSSVSPYEPIRIFYQDYLNHHNKRLEADALAQGRLSVFIEQAIWIALLRSFAFWFEEVCPWQKVSAVREPFFCFNRGEDRDQFDEDAAMEDTATTSKYFEYQPRDREVGIKLSGLTKVFDNIRAVSDVSFSIYKGETTLLLGHNGAGKTTLMSMILGLLNPDEGCVRIGKHSNGIASMGVCPQLSILDDNLTVSQHLELFYDIKSGVGGRRRNENIKQTIDDVSMMGELHKRPPEMSGGMRRKLSLGIAFVGKSDVLILDEPSSGLDPESRMSIWNAIRRYRADRTVLLSTQHMEEADYLGDRIAIMSRGQIVCCGSSVYLNKLFGTGYKLRIECKEFRRKDILDHIRDYFGNAQPEEGQELPVRVARDVVNADFVVELKMKSKDDDAELRLISLLEDIESHSSAIGIHSYCLKCSSIEDVMLNTGKYFSPPDLEPTSGGASTNNASDGNLSDLTLVNRPSRLTIISALCTKQLQVWRIRWKLVLVIKLILPILGSFDIMYGSGVERQFWQSPFTVIMIGNFVYFPAREQVSKFKTMQLVSATSVWLYWLSHSIMDFLSVLICLISVNIFLRVTLDVTFLVPVWQVHLFVSLATLLFCLASMMFCYTLSTILTNADSSYGYMVIMFAMSTIVHIALGSSSSPDRGLIFSNILDYALMLFVPGDGLRYFLSGLTTDCYYRDAVPSTNACVPVKGPSRVLVGLLALVFNILLYSALLCLIELHKIDLSWYLRARNTFYCFVRRKSPGAKTIVANTDEDVQEETEKALASIKSPTSTENSLAAAKLNKSYYRDTRVIQDLSFTVKKGECFGLLGVNGAGKSTTFSMLSAEMPPDSGKILANGHYMDQKLHKYRSMIGYDPQSNPELSLTAHQALTLMAKLRGVNQGRIPALINSITDLLEMREHINKLDSQLSGGTKRKLSLGMALIGSPSILILDEPTAGIDPFARRGVWRLLRSVKTQGNVSTLISSHAMEESETICDRISILASGQLRCIGTFLHLRSKFGSGCTLRIQFSLRSSYLPEQSSDRLESIKYSGSLSRHAPTQRQPAQQAASVELTDPAEASVPELRRLLDAAIRPKNYALVDKNATSLTFVITDNRVKRSILFKTMREFRYRNPNVSYMINDSSLEDIFITLAREQYE